METVTLIWWNVQRLFHPSNSELARELAATAANGWTRDAYNQKLQNLAAVLLHATDGKQPALLALGEVENSKVVSDLMRVVGWTGLREATGGADPAIEGYDITLLYSPDHFELAEPPRSHVVHNRYATRDIFETRLRASNGEEFLVLTNHWPSRMWTGAEGLRIGLGDYCSRIVERTLKYRLADMVSARGEPRLPSRSKLEARWNLPVLVWGDMNDNPFDRSVDQMLRGTRERKMALKKPRFPRTTGRKGVEAYMRLRPRLYNPTWELLSDVDSPTPGTVQWSSGWEIVDQVLVSPGMLGPSGLRMMDRTLRIHGPRDVPGLDGGTVSVRTRGGRPRRFDARSLSGVSDHLPLLFEMEIRG